MKILSKRKVLLLLALFALGGGAFIWHDELFGLSFDEEKAVRDIFGNSYSSLPVRATERTQNWKLIRTNEARYWIYQPLVRRFTDAGQNKLLLILESQPVEENNSEEPCSAHACGADVHALLYKQKSDTWQLERAGLNLDVRFGSYGHGPKADLIQTASRKWAMYFSNTYCSTGECMKSEKTVELTDLKFVGPAG